MQQYRQLSCGGDNRSLLTVSSTALRQFQSPASEITVDPERSQDMLRPLHQQRPQIRIAFLADVQLRFALSRFPASRMQSQIATHVATLAEAMGIFQRQQKRQRDQRAYPLDLLQQLDLRVTRLRQRFDSVVVLHNAFAQFFDRRQQRLQRPLQLWTQPFGFLWIHVAHVAAAQAFAVALGQPAGRVHQTRSRPHRPARARIIIRSACACALRCFTGYSNSGSIRANRASVCASRRSSFLRLSPINRTLRAWATITSCPNSLRSRLIQGECVPVSSAIRLRGMAPKTSCNTFAVVRTRYSSCIRPASSSTQDQALRSPRSSPMVSCCCEIFLLCFVAAVLTFFIAGLLFICASSTSITWERTPHPVRRPAFSSHLITAAIVYIVSTVPFRPVPLRL